MCLFEGGMCCGPLAGDLLCSSVRFVSSCVSTSWWVVNSDTTQEERLAKKREEEQKAAEEQRRLDHMLRDKQAREAARMQRSGATAPVRAIPSREPEMPAGPPVGTLTVRILCASDLPAALVPWSQVSAYAVARVGKQSFWTRRSLGSNPVWGNSFTFNVQRVDTALRIKVYQERASWGLFGDDLLGNIEIPFLDLEEWSGCVIGRVVEPVDSMKASCMVLELEGRFEWC